MDRTQEESSEEAGPYQETVRYEVMAPLERWLLYAQCCILWFMLARNLWILATSPK